MQQAPTATHRRIAVVTPTGRVDLVVPAHLTVADLVPVVVELGRVADDTDGHGWHLGRVGHAALDPERSLTAAGVRDGDVLDLRPSTLTESTPVFDEITDAVAAAAAERVGGNTAFVGPLALAGAVVLLAVAVLQAWTGGTAVPSAVTAVALLTAAFLSSRRVPDRSTAVVLGVAAVGFAAAAVGTWTTGPGVTVAVAGTVAGVGLVASRLVAAGRTVFVALTTGGVMVSVGRALAGWCSWSRTELAAVAVVVGLAVLPSVPRVAARLAGLRRPGWSRPAGVAGGELAVVMAAARRAVDTVAGLYAAVSVAMSGAAVVLAGGGGPGVALAVAVAVALLTRSRTVDVPAQAAALGVPAAAASLTAGALWLRDATVAPEVGMLGAVALAGAALTAARVASAVHRPPVWDRGLRLVEAVSVLAVIPLAVAVADGYRFVRQW